MEVKLLAGLKKYGPASNQLLVEENETVADIIRRLDINSELIRNAFLDGRFVSLETKITGSRKLLLLPAIGGG